MSFYFVFQNYYDYYRFFTFLYKFYNQIVNFYTKSCWNFDREYNESVHQFGENFLPHYIEFSIL